MGLTGKGATDDPDKRRIGDTCFTFIADYCQNTWTALFYLWGEYLKEARLADSGFALDDNQAAYFVVIQSRIGVA